MTKKQKKMLIRILVAAALMLILRFVPLPLSGVSMFLLWLIPYFIIGYDILRKAWKGILNRQVFDENFLMAVATLGALAIGLLKTGDYDEAVAVDRRTVPELCRRQKPPEYQRADGHPAGLCQR